MAASGLVAGTVLGAVVVLASWFDMRERRLPNWLCGLNLAAGLANSAIVSDWSGAAMALVHVAVALVGGMVLNAVGAVGAGDAKFYASMAAWFPLGMALWLLTSVAIAGFVLLVGFIAWRRLSVRQPGGPREQDFAKLPYGVAIGVGGLAAFAML